MDRKLAKSLDILNSNVENGYSYYIHYSGEKIKEAVTMQEEPILESEYIGIKSQSGNLVEMNKEELLFLQHFEQVGNILKNQLDLIIESKIGYITTRIQKRNDEGFQTVWKTKDTNAIEALIKLEKEIVEYKENTHQSRSK